MIVVYDEAGNILYARPGVRPPASLPPGQRAMVVPGLRTGQVAAMRVDVRTGQLLPVEPSTLEARRRMEAEGWQRIRRGADAIQGPGAVSVELEALRRRIKQLERRLSARATPDPTSSAGSLGG